jgi:hypothetical protein
MQEPALVHRKRPPLACADVYHVRGGETGGVRQRGFRVGGRWRRRDVLQDARVVRRKSERGSGPEHPHQTRPLSKRKCVWCLPLAISTTRASLCSSGCTLSPSGYGSPRW